MFPSTGLEHAMQSVISLDNISQSTGSRDFKLAGTTRLCTRETSFQVCVAIGQIVIIHGISSCMGDVTCCLETQRKKGNYLCSMEMSVKTQTAERAAQSYEVNVRAVRTFFANV